MIQSRFYIRLFNVIAIALLINTINAQNLVKDSYGKGLSIQAMDSSFLVKFGFRIQTLYVGEQNLDTDKWKENLLIRRSRLKFDGYAFSPNIEYKIELGLSNRDINSGRIAESGNTANILLDAFVKWKFAKGWELWVGQTKLPGNRERVISSQKLQFVDRSLVNSRYNLDRDIGLQLRHKSKIGNAIINQALALTTGEGRDIIIANPYNGRQITGRLEFLPFGAFTSKGDYFGADLKREQDPKLSLGVTASLNNNTARTRGNLGNFVSDSSGAYITSDLTTYFVDGIFKYRGFSFASEYAYRSTDSKVDGFGYGSGFTASGGYLFNRNIEMALRYTTISPISDFSSINKEEEYTLGISKYVKEHNLKIQSDYTYLMIDGPADKFIVRVQVEMAF